jgi:hypothetical protein
MSRLHFSILASALASVAPLSGCTSDDESNPTMTRERRPLSAWDEVSPLLGFSIADALPDELYTSDLIWNERTVDLKFSPSASQTRLHWCLAVPDPRSGLSRFEEVDIECEPELALASAASCSDRLEATLLLRLKSDDGALAETLPVTFTALNQRAASFSASDLAANAFTGSFLISNTGRPGLTLHLGAFGSIDPREASGALLAEWVGEGEPSGDGTLVYTVANWTTARTAGSSGPPCSDF